MQQLSKEALAKLQNYEFGSLTKSLLDSEWGKEVSRCFLLSLLVGSRQGRFLLSLLVTGNRRQLCN